MEILSIRWKNIGPYGENWSELDFTGTPSLWQLIGRNGHGKSTVMRVLKLGLYQEADGILQDGIANELNGEGEISVRVRSADGRVWRIDSGFSPSYLRVFKDGEEKPEDLGGVKTTKKFIRGEIVTMPYHVFCNVLSLSAADFKSFLKMKAEDARSIRDRIFSFHIVNQMMTLLRKRLKEAADECATQARGQQVIAEQLGATELQLQQLQEADAQGLSVREEELEAEGRRLEQLRAAQVQGRASLTTSLAVEDFGRRWIRARQLQAEFEELRGQAQGIQQQLAAYDAQGQTLEGEEALLVLEQNLLRSQAIHRQVEQTEREAAELRRQIDLDQSDLRLLGLAAGQAEEELRGLQTLQQVEQRHGVLREFWLRVQTLDAAELADASAGQAAEGTRVRLAEGLAKTEASLLKHQGLRDKAQQGVNLYAAGQCPTCETDLTCGSHAGGLDRQREALQAAETKIQELEALLSKVRPALSAAEAQVAQVGRSIQARAVQRATLQAQLAVQVFPPELAQLVQDFAAGSLTTFPELSAEQRVDPHALTLASRKLAEAQSLQATQRQKVERETQRSQLLERQAAQLRASLPPVSESVSTLRHQTPEAYDPALSETRAKVAETRSVRARLQGELSLLQQRGKALLPQIEPEETFRAQFGMAVQPWTEQELAEVQRERAARESEWQATENSLQAAQQTLAHRLEDLQRDRQERVRMQGVEKLLAESKTKLEACDAALAVAQARLDEFRTVEYLLSDEGIKAYVLRDIVPSLNAEIASVLSLLDVPLAVTFDEEFLPHVFRFGREVQLLTISLGQTKMADYAIVLAITKVLKLRYGSVNLIFYDEFFASIDPGNRAILLDIMHRVCCQDLGLHTILVNHVYLPSAAFGQIALTEHRNSFSTLAVMSPDEYETRFLHGDEASPVQVDAETALAE